MADTPAWTRRLGIIVGDLQSTRRRNSDQYEFHISPEMEGELDAIVSREQAQSLVDEMNRKGYSLGDDYLKQELPDLVKQHGGLPIFLYVTDRCNRD